MGNCWPPCMHVYWLNRYYRGVVQGTTKEKYYNVLFDDGFFCNDLRSADIVVSIILAMGVFTSSEWEDSRERQKERDPLQKYRIYFFPVVCGSSLNIQMLINKTFMPWNSSLFTSRLLASESEETTVLALSTRQQITPKKNVLVLE